MIYRFGDFCLDARKCELRSGGAHVPLEPQVFALLQLLVDNRDRLVSRDEIIDRIWNGRIVSDAAVSSRVKSARQAIGDDGELQRLIRTVPKLGFRFVAEVEVESGVEPSPSPETPPSEPSRAPLTRPSIAVLPFQVIGDPQSAAGLFGDALPHDLIAELSRLRWLLVIARGSSFRFRGPDVDLERVRRELNVRYCLSGTLEVQGRSIALAVELSDTSDQSVVWSDRFRSSLDGAHELRGAIVQAVIAALELHIPLREALQARLRAPENLDAWSAYHLGLNHMYRFSKEGNERAAALFERAIQLEPSFARAHAGLSFTHFENAFLNFTPDAATAASRAEQCAENGLEFDPLDPFCNLVRGRVFWLRGDLESSLPWLDRAIHLNPNFAQAKYSRAWTETLMGHALDGRANVAAAMQLSPLDPLAYGMLGVRAFSHMILDEPEAAADWGERAARTPGAHALIETIAAVGHALNGKPDLAEPWVASARRRHPELSAATFMAAFPFRESDTKARIGQALARLGL